MITILSGSKNPVAVLDDYFGDEISEQINGAYTLKFSVYLDDDKSQYIQVGNYAEVEGQYFNITHHRRTRSENGEVVISVECEQVSYDLLFHLFEGGFIHAGTPRQLLAMALDGTGFSVGNVQSNGYISVDLKEGVNARGVIMEIAAQAEAELKLDKYTVNLISRMGQDRGVQFRLGKNLKGIVKDVNSQSGEVLTAYEVDVVELNSLPEFEGLEYFELGDTVQIVDEELGINEQQRIIQYSYSPRRRINSKVVIANRIQGIQDSVYRIQTTTVGKDKYYYGTRIGPDVGFESVRWDKKARSVMNADEIKIQKGNGNGSWTNAIYMDANGDARFTGIVEAASFLGGTIAIGFGNQIFKAGPEGISLGHANFSSAPFSVNMSGKMKAVDGEFKGEITASTIRGGYIYGTDIEGVNIRGSTISTRNGNSKGVVMNSGWADLEVYSGISSVGLVFAIQDLLNDMRLWFKRDGIIESGRQIHINAPDGVFVNDTRIG